MGFSAEQTLDAQPEQQDYFPTGSDCLSAEQPLQPVEEQSLQDVEEQKHRKGVDKLIPVSVLIVALSIAYYYVIALPQQERTRTVLYSLALSRIERQIEAIAQKAEQEKRQKAATATQSAKEKAAHFNTCLLTARQDYENIWTEKCQSAAALLTTRLHDCSATATKEQCTKRWGAIDSSASCALSPVIATPINESYATAKAECFQRYPQG